MPSLFAVKFPEPQFKHFLLVAMRSPVHFQTVLKDEQGYYLNPECLYTRTGEPVPRIPLYRIPGPHEQFTDSPDMIGNPSLHGRSDAQGLMNPADVVPSKIERHGGL